MAPYTTAKQKQHWKDKWDKVRKLVEELDIEDILDRKKAWLVLHFIRILLTIYKGRLKYVKKCN